MEIVIDGYNINYKISGEGEEYAVILQGWGTEMALYDTIAACIGQKFKVVQFDFPGFGASDEPREPWDVDAYADFFEKFMKTLGIEKAVLFGHSYGGRVIIKLATRQTLGFEIDRIILIDSAGVMPKRSFWMKLKVMRYKMFKKFVSLKPIHAICPNLIDEWKNKQGSEDYRNASPMMKQCMVKAINEDLTHLLPMIEQETLLIWGDNDTATPISDAHVMEEKIPNSGLAVIKGTGHYSFLEQPAVFRSIMNSYFQIK